jgi:hypothetical protein
MEVPWLVSCYFSQPVLVSLFADVLEVFADVLVEQLNFVD